MKRLLVLSLLVLSSALFTASSGAQEDAGRVASAGEDPNLAIAPPAGGHGSEAGVPGPGTGCTACLANTVGGRLGDQTAFVPRSSQGNSDSRDATR